MSGKKGRLVLVCTSCEGLEPVDVRKYDMKLIHELEKSKSTFAIYCHSCHKTTNHKVERRENIEELREHDTTVPDQSRSTPAPLPERRRMW